jgi:hypothetical protein
MEMFWIDGNHDNHPMLWDGRYEVGFDGFAQIRPNLFYIPRGLTWEWQGVSFIGVGGSYSIDKEWRVREEAVTGKPASLWWPTEMISPEDVEKIVSRPGRVDVMFSHDVPHGLDVPGIHSPVNSYRWPLAVENRDRLTTIFEAKRPRLIVHGHYHVRYDDTIDWMEQGDDGNAWWNQTQVIGLANDGLPGFAVILDFAALFGRTDDVG